MPEQRGLGPRIPRTGRPDEALKLLREVLVDEEAYPPRELRGAPLSSVDSNLKMEVTRIDVISSIVLAVSDREIADINTCA